jgi:hypothetical protein
MATTDLLYAPMSELSHLLPARSPWLYRMGDIVRLESGEMVQILDGFLHVRRAVGSREPSFVRRNSTVLIIRSVSEGSSL